LDNQKERSRSRSARRRHDSDSYDSRSPSPRRDRHKRSKSVTDYARKGLAAIGLGEAVVAEKDKRRDRNVEETRVIRKTRRYSDDSDDDNFDRRSRNGDARGDPYGDSRYADSRSSVGRSNRKDGRRNREIAEGKRSGSSSDLGSSSGDEKRRKKMQARSRR